MERELVEICSGKSAAYRWLPALWLEKYFFHWQILPPDPLFFFILL